MVGLLIFRDRLLRNVFMLIVNAHSLTLTRGDKKEIFTASISPCRKLFILKGGDGSGSKLERPKIEKVARGKTILNKKYNYSTSITIIA